MNSCFRRFGGHSVPMRGVLGVKHRASICWRWGGLSTISSNKYTVYSSTCPGIIGTILVTMQNE